MSKTIKHVYAYVTSLIFFALGFIIIFIFAYDLTTPDAVETLLDWQFYLPVFVFFPSLMFFIGFFLLSTPVQRGIIYKLIKYFGYTSSFSCFALAVFQLPLWINGYIYLPRFISLLLLILLPCGVGFGIYKLTSIKAKKSIEASK